MHAWLVRWARPTRTLILRQPVMNVSLGHLLRVAQQGNLHASSASLAWQILTILRRRS
eukprot:SAG11_NODE_31452_length_291_cov_3.807292_1_plen_57_part_10